jgi:hypothetical protein
MPSATASTPLSVVKYFFSSLLLFILGAKVRLSEQNAKFWSSENREKCFFLY